MNLYIVLGLIIMPIVAYIVTKIELRNEERDRLNQ